MQVASIVPDTILRWYRRLIAQKYDGSSRRRRGRPMTLREIADLVVRMAGKNPQGGSARIQVLPSPCKERSTSAKSESI